MASELDLVLRLTNLVGYGWGDVNSNRSSPDDGAPGAYYYCHDAQGPKILQYVRNRSGSATVKGDLLSYASDAGGTRAFSVANITSGTRTSAVVTGLTAGDHDGKICFMLDNAATAGAAPEGESSIVAVNTATLITLESSYPFSVALAVNDDLELIANYQVHDSADGDENWVVAGVSLGRDGISDGNYGWVLKEGDVNATTLTGALVEGDPVVADAKALGTFGSDSPSLHVGIVNSVVTADQVAPFTGQFIMRTVSGAGPGVVA